MKELRDRQKFKGFLYSLPSLVVLLLVTFLMAKGAVGIMSKKHETAQKLETLEEENALLRERQATLATGIAKLETEAGVIEEIRAKFNAARSGEHLAVIVEEKARATTTVPSVVERLKMGWSWVKSLWTF